MNRQQPQSNDQDKFARYVPFAAIVVLVVVSYFVMFQPGFGIINEASAQINPVAIGEDLAGQLSETAGRTSLDDAVEQPAEEAAPVDILETGATPPSVGTAGSELQYTISDADVGGTDFKDLTPEEIREHLYQLPELRGSDVLIDKAMPVLIRFQTMVKPPWEWTEEGDDPVESGARRYSPFDPVGLRHGPRGPRVTPFAMPPFPPLEDTGGLPERGEPNAYEAALASVVVGILGEPGNFLAIIEGGGERRQLRIGDEIQATERTTFVVTEISPSGVTIQNIHRTGDIGRIKFRSGNEDISGITMSISY